MTDSWDLTPATPEEIEASNKRQAEVYAEVRRIGNSVCCGCGMLRGTLPTGQKAYKCRDNGKEVVVLKEPPCLYGEHTWVP